MTTDVTASPVRAGAQPAQAGAAPGLPVPVAIGLAIAAGAAMLLAFPPYDLWWLAPVAVALLAVAVHRRRIWAGAGIAGLTGLVFFIPLLSWTNIEVGNVPWLVLAALQAGFVALLGAAAALLSVVVDRWWWSWPVLTGLAWVGQESLRSRLPFGGFPWGRLAFSQGDSPLLGFAAVAGAPLVTFAVAVTGGLLALAAAAVLSGWRSGRWLPGRWLPERWLAGRWLAGRWSAGRRLPGGRALGGAIPSRLTGAGGLLAAAVLVVLAGWLVPIGPASGTPVTVAFVQGNVPRLGLDFNAQRRAVLDNHVDATIDLADRVAAGEAPAPELVVWPENASDIDPLRNRDAGARITEAAAAIGAPILVGTLRYEPDGSAYNVGLVWDPEQGPGEVYRKRHPVPFAEYLPMRSAVLPVARAVIPDWESISLLRDHEGWSAGEAPGVLAVGPAMVGDVICFEVAYDGLVRDTVTGGAELLTVQTNNATFNEAEALQQLAMVRVRAVEHGRDALMASTVGVSGFVGADGRVSDATGFFTQDVRVRTLTRTDARTPATVLGVWPELVFAAGAGAALVVAAGMRRRMRGS